MATNTQIIYYDFGNLKYSSFFLAGFLDKARAYGYEFTISRELPPLLSDPDMSSWRHILPFIFLFMVKAGRESLCFCIDTRDSNTTSVGEGYHLPLLKRVDLYFKVNYHERVIREDDNLAPFADKIKPVRPFFPVRPQKALALVPNALVCRTAGWTLNDTVRRVKYLLQIPTLNEVASLRKSKKTYDLVFLTTYYDDHPDLNEFRYQLMKEIQSCKQINGSIGFASKLPLPGKFAEFQRKPMWLMPYLRHVANSKIAIYVRGVGDCVSFKFSQQLCMGMPVIGQKIINNAENMYQSRYFSDQFAFEDPAEILREVLRILRDPARLAALGASNAAVFDTEYTPDVVASSILGYLPAFVPQQR